MRDLQLNIDYMCHLAGSSHYYMGRDMKTTHAGLGITEGEWKANIKYMANALDKHKIPQREKSEVLALVEGLSRHIVEKPSPRFELGGIAPLLSRCRVPAVRELIKSSLVLLISLSNGHWEPVRYLDA